jgi:uncharacterized protein YecA (UPF0149 family)
MSLHDQWNKLADEQRTEEENNKFWNTYLEKETENYKYILEHNDEIVSGKLSELAEEFGMDTVMFAGFIDGMNTSLVQAVNLEELTEDTQIKLEVDFEKLYYNMLDAKAHWLYKLPQWEKIHTEEKRNQIAKEYNREHIAVSNKVGRNEPCTCGSGKKYKKCCGA